VGEAFSVYCDESCHLPRDGQSLMVLGGVWCPTSKAAAAFVRVREIKARHGMPPGFEAKWTKVSPAKAQLYMDLVDYFFDDDDLHFRALIATGKETLDHQAFEQDHDTWYYKMYFDMLKVILEPGSEYAIYVDIKDTRSGAKMAKLHDVLCNNMYDFEREILQRVQTVRSDEVELLQLADLLIGAVSYANRGLCTSQAKTGLVERMRQRSGYSLLATTLLREDKVNLFVWRPTGAER